MSPLAERSDMRLRADSSRVITREFLPGQESMTRGISRAESVVERILALSDEEVSHTLAAVLADFGDRHPDLRATFREHFGLVSHRLPQSTSPDLSDERIDLIGAYLTQEYAIEGGALFNPSIVAHPDQSDCEPGELRFVMSVRAVGEGHWSSVEFRTGVVGSDHNVRLDEPGRLLSIGTTTAVPLTAGFLRASLAQQGDSVAAESILRLLPATFTPSQIEEVLASSELDSTSRDDTGGLIIRIRQAAASSYRVRFPTDRALSERVLVPRSSAESHGIEDVRLVRFVDERGTVTYFGTYTAFDGSRIAPHLIRTPDFATFDMGPMIGPAAQNKGMALFPRRIDGDMWSLSRWDRENISVTRSPDGFQWGAAKVVLTPGRPWDLIQLGPCSSPIETADGWLVLIHGVGPMRSYGIGAMLLDLDDPTLLIGVLADPLLVPLQDERDGYVPNVVYTCGALLHDDFLVVPYGCSDDSIGFASIDVAPLLEQLRRAP